jgi:RNA methyltransferase, TrmH family
MLIDKISSRQNPLVRRFREVRQGRERHLVLLEGIRLVSEAVQSQLHFEAVVYTTRLQSTPLGGQLYQKLATISCRGAMVNDSIMDAISDVENSQGIAALAHIPYTSPEDLFRTSNPLIIIAHGLQDPGNLGTLIRTAEASGVDTLITTPGTVNPFSPKALRAAMGSSFRLPLVLNLPWANAVSRCHQANLTLVAADQTARERYTDYNWNQPTALIIGQEGNGLDASAQKVADRYLAIPMRAPVESLNVATATAIMLYEAVRQRQ